MYIVCRLADYSLQQPIRRPYRIESVAQTKSGGSQHAVGEWVGAIVNPHEANWERITDGNIKAQQLGGFLLTATARISLNPLGSAFSEHWSNPSCPSTLSHYLLENP